MRDSTIAVLATAATAACAAATWLPAHVCGNKHDVTKSSMRAIASAVETFRVRNARLPADLQELCPSFIEAEEPPKDSWGNEFLYIPTPSGQFEIVSFGADGQLGGEQEDADLTLADARAK